MRWEQVSQRRALGKFIKTIKVKQLKSSVNNDLAMDTESVQHKSRLNSLRIEMLENYSTIFTPCSIVFTIHYFSKRYNCF